RRSTESLQPATLHLSSNSNNQHSITNQNQIQMRSFNQTNMLPKANRLSGGKLFSMLLLMLLSFVGAQAQIAVTVTGATNTTPNLATSYTSLANALTGLNAVTAMTGPVTFTLAAGGSETAPATGLSIGSASLDAVLSATNTVTIVK